MAIRYALKRGTRREMRALGDGPSARGLRIRRWWDGIRGERARRLRELKRHRALLAMDWIEARLEAMADRATGRERVEAVNDLFWVRAKRLAAGYLPGYSPGL